MSKEVVLIADDLGMTPEINDAIFHAHGEGGLMGASLMMAQPGTAEAVKRARATPSLQVGWHLHLCDSFPATRSHWPWGGSPAAAGWRIGLSSRAKALVRAEIRRQWELFQATGLPCAFINTHHHLHLHPFVYRCLREIVGSSFTGWIRLGRTRFFRPGPADLAASQISALVQMRRRRLSPWRAADTLWGLDLLFQMTAAEVEAAILSLPDGLHEFLFHPRSRTCPDTLCLLRLKSRFASS
jgi:predicted glycoside hydrolase/deacetylase ChbG (UPF0249 family)